MLVWEVERKNVVHMGVMAADGIDVKWTEPVCYIRSGRIFVSFVMNPRDS
jgi:hypothetical protein